MTTPIIRARNLTKRFGDFTAVDDLSFSVAPGSIFAFLGANGSGKSTTIRMLIGLLTPTAGDVELAGIDVIRSPRRVRDLIGYMGQRVSLYGGLSLRENLEFYAGLYDLTGAALEQRWGALLERFGLAEAEHEKASELPAGIRQRAGLALSTLHRPRVLFLDEPTAGVDVQNRLRFWDLIQEEADAGVTVFVTTHFLEEAEYCDWVCFIDAGRLIANAAPDTIRRRYSHGYRIALALPGAERHAAAQVWREAGATVVPTDAGLEVAAPALTPAMLDALAVTAAKGADGTVHVEQPEMGDVFRELMRHPQAPPQATAETDEAPAHAHVAPAASPPPFQSARAPTGTLHAPTRRSMAVTLAARWRRLRTLMRREVRATLRDPFTVAMLIAVPIGALLAFGYTLAVNVKDLALGVHDASGTSSSRRIVAELAANGTFTPRRFATRERLERALVSGDISVALVIPPDFDRQLHRQQAGGRLAEMQVLYDGGETVVAGNAEAFAQAITAVSGGALLNGQRGGGTGGTRVGEAAPGSASGGGGLRVVTRVLFNPTLNGVPFMVAGTYGFVLTFLTTLITAVSIVNEKLSGTFEQLQVTPAAPGGIVLGKILPLGAVFALDVVLMVVISGFLLGVWPAGSVVFFIAVACFYVLISLALGLIFSATSATAAEAVQKTVLFSIPLNFLGGFIFPVRNMPFFFRELSQLLPATHFIAISRAIYLRAAGPLTLLPDLALLGLFGAVLMTIAFRTVARRA
jgi:ABC-2 type transport system permease protein